MSDVLLEVPSRKSVAYFNMYKLKATNFFPLLSIQQQIKHTHTEHLGRFNSLAVALQL